MTLIVFSEGGTHRFSEGGVRIEAPLRMPLFKRTYLKYTMH